MKLFEEIRYMVRNVSRNLTENKIKCWADCGTLLGFIRDGDVIEWDTDADFSYFKKDRDKLILSLVKMIPKHQYRLHITTTGRIRLFSSFDSISPLVDFYMFENDSGLPSETGFLKEFTVDPKTKVILFETEYEFNLPIPKKYTERLIHLYGVDYLTPIKTDNYWG